MPIDKAKLAKARSLEKAQAVVGHCCGRLGMRVAGEPALYHALDECDRADVDRILSELRCLSHSLRCKSKELRNQARGGLI